VQKLSENQATQSPQVVVNGSNPLTPSDPS